MKKNRLFSNTCVNVVLQLSVVISGLIIPNLIIHHYGSEINGMISSINQLLSYITLLEAGIGAVVKAELYKPLVEQNYQRLNEVYSATQNFYSKIGYVFLGYLAIIALLFKKISNSSFDWNFSASLVIILGISILVQYFIGLTNQTLLQADQQYWFTSSVQIITLWMTVFITVILIKNDASIQIVKLLSGLLFALRPICYLIYAQKKYKIKPVKNVPKNIISQKWDGFGHHIAYFIHTNTDVVIITFFLNLKEVSVYSIYLMIVTGVRSFLAAIASAMEPYFGKLLAIGNMENVKKKFAVYELFYYVLSTILFSATLNLALPFVCIYTKGVTDVNYHRPYFAFLIILAEWFYCIRSPYSMIVFASGHFKQTRNGAFTEAIFNILISLFLVHFYGIVGVVIGTVVAMLFRTTQYVVYLKKHILMYDTKIYFVRLFVVALSALSLFFVCSKIEFNPLNYRDWIFYAIVVTALSVLTSFAMFFAVFRKDMIDLIKISKRFFLR